MDRDTELAALRAEVTALTGRMNELEGKKVDANLSPDWNDSGCTIDTDWEYSASHWADDGGSWESSSADC